MREASPGADVDGLWRVFDILYRSSIERVQNNAEKLKERENERCTGRWHLRTPQCYVSV